MTKIADRSSGEGGIRVVCLMAITLDGKIAKSADHFPDWTEKADKKLFVEMTKKAGVVIFGSRTFDTIGRALPGRRNVVMTRDATRHGTSEDGNLVFSGDSPEELLKKLENDGFSEAILAGGAKINSIFARKKLIDELVVTISPRIFGEGISIFEDGVAMNLKLKSVEKLGRESVVVRYFVKSTKNNIF